MRDGTRGLTRRSLHDELRRLRTRRTIGPLSLLELEHTMPIEALLVWLVIGAIAGFLAGTVVKGYGFGLVGNIVVGIIGAVIAGALLPRLGVGFNSDIVGQILSATLGAIGLLLVIGVVRRTA